MEVLFRESPSCREAPEIVTADNIEPSPGAGITPLDLRPCSTPGSYHIHNAYFYSGSITSHNGHAELYINSHTESYIGSHA